MMGCEENTAHGRPRDDEPTPAQMNCGRCLYGPPALCTCGTCPKEYHERWMPAAGWPEEWIADGPPSNIHILQADKPHMRVCFMTSDGPAQERAALIAQAPALRACIAEMVNAWEPDEGGSDHAMWEWAKDILAKIADDEGDGPFTTDEVE